MTNRLYYSDSFLYEFSATVADVMTLGDRTALVLDQTAFYPNSGGQLSDIGWIEAKGTKLRVAEVSEDENGSILHYLDGGIQVALEPDIQVRGSIDVDRRQDHMRQHSGQHVISAAFEKLFSMPTVSFHMGDESCTIDLAIESSSPAQAKTGLERGTLTDEQVRQAERESNRIVMEDRPVEIRSATAQQARTMGVRKIPDHVEGELRLIDIRDYDLNACGGTHVRSTGQIGPILLRHFEKVKQGFRVEFVCGERAITTARRDFETLTTAAASYAAHIWAVPDLVRRSLDEAKAAAKERKKLLEEIAELLARRMLAEASGGIGFKLIPRFFADRDVNFVKLLAQKITAAAPSVVLFGAGVGQPGVVFAQSPGLPHDMGALMKEALATLGGRGGGNRDLAQGGAADAAKILPTLDALAAKIQSIE
jgi:alanyl-tRNA synthetase